MKKPLFGGLLTFLFFSLALIGVFAEDSAEHLVISAIFLDASVDFAQFIKAGMDAAAEEFGVTVHFDGPVDYNLDQQLAILQNHIKHAPDGIALASLSSEDLAPLIAEAMDIGIPVVTYNSDAATSRRLAYYGQNLMQSGRIQAETLIEYMGDTGQVLIVTIDALAAWSHDREQGNRDVLAMYPGIQVVGLIDGQGDTQNIYAPLEKALRDHPDLTGIVSLDALTTPITGTMLLQLQRHRTIKHVGHDLMSETLENIMNGGTNATLGQNPYLQGYLAIKALVDYLRKGILPESVDTGVERVDDLNVKDYWERIQRGDRTLG